MYTIRQILLLGAAILLISHPQLQAQQPTGTHNEEYCLFKGAYPANDDIYWGDDDALTNGIAHDNSNWFITALSTDYIGRPGGSWAIWRIPVYQDLLASFTIPPGDKKVKDEVPELSAYEHAGDLDCYRHAGNYYLLIPFTGPDVYRDSIDGEGHHHRVLVSKTLPAIAFFRADNLSYINYAVLDTLRQHDVGWCAVHPITGRLYTSRDDAYSFLEYTIDWNRIFDTEHHDAISCVDSFAIHFTLHNGQVDTLFNMQGGEFSPSGGLLYVNCGIITCFSVGKLYDQDGLHVFETTNWQHVRRSVTHVLVTDDGKIIRQLEPGCFEYTFDNSGCSGEEPEGLTIWDLDNASAPHISGQLHVLSYNHNTNPFHSNAVFLNHYATVKVDAGPDTSTECRSPSTTSVRLGCTLDNNSICGPLTLLWSCPGVAFDDPASPTPLGQFPKGTSIVTITASEDQSTSTDTILVHIVDTTPPVITMRANTILLWPPDHTYHTVNVDDCIAAVTDICDAAPTVTVVSVASDEAEDARGGGDGNTTNDAVIICPNTVRLRAERNGNGNGRVYRITYAATDCSGNRATVVSKVYVPHDNSGSLAVDGPGPGYSITSSCGSGGQGLLKEEGLTSTLNRLPTSTQLQQNYPNPFNPTTTIQFSIHSDEFVSLTIYSVLGTEVANLISESLTAGYYAYKWDAANLPSGVYFCRLHAGSIVQTKKLLLLR